MNKGRVAEGKHHCMGPSHSPVVVDKTVPGSNPVPAYGSRLVMACDLFRSMLIWGRLQGRPQFKEYGKEDTMLTKEEKALLKEMAGDVFDAMKALSRKIRKSGRVEFAHGVDGLINRAVVSVQYTLQKQLKLKSVSYYE